MFSLSILLPLAIISFLAGMAKGVTGFGAALVMAPLFGLLLPAPEVGALIVLVHCATSLQGLRRWAGLVRWKSVLPLALVALAALICTALAMRWLVDADNPAWRRAIGIAVLGVTGLHMRGWRWRHAGGMRPTVIAGVISGAMTALGGIGGPSAVYYFSGMQEDSVTMLRANLLGYFAVLFCGATLILAANRQIHVPLLASTLLLIPAFAGGVLIGERIHGCLPPIWFNRIVTGLLLVSGLVALLG